jgi:hypothetical protein
VNPVFAPQFAALGHDTAAAFLELPGEVVSGHPDRHVARVALPDLPTAFYLKRQHAVTWRERLRNRLAGFGWVSRCVREAAILKQLAAAGLPCPRWVAFGEDRGRAFLLVEELAAADLREVLSDSALTLAGRRALAERLGRLIGSLHAAGFTTPDLTAKHVLVSPDSGELTLLDWQSARRTPVVSEGERVRALAALHASVADELATPRERLRVLRTALGPGRLAGFARRVEREAAKLRGRRSIRDQRQPAVTANAQRLVWVAGEAVCAVPDVAAVWPKPAVSPPFYGCQPGTLSVRLPDRREGTLIRGLSFTPLARLSARLRGRPWRSPGVTLGRVLFHLERYGVPAPRLLAFGQRLTGPASAEWFALHAIPAEPVSANPEPATAEHLGRVLRRLHDAGCRLVGNPLGVFGANECGVSVRDVTRVRIVKRVTPDDRKRDLEGVRAALPPAFRAIAEAGYHGASDVTTIQSPVLVDVS